MGGDVTYLELLAESIRKQVPTYRGDSGVLRHDGGFAGCNGAIVVRERHPSGQLCGMRTFSSTGTCEQCGASVTHTDAVGPAAEKAGLFPWNHDRVV
jgi:hypothetical protein